MSIKLRAKLDQYLENENLHFDINDAKQLCIKEKCGKKIVTFYDLTFAKKDPTELEIDFVKLRLNKIINELNNDLQKLKELEEIVFEPIDITKSWNKKDTYTVDKNNMQVTFNIKTKEITKIKMEVKSIQKIDEQKAKINELVDKATKQIEIKLKKEEILSKLNQNCGI